MQSYHVNDIAAFMKHFLATDTFDALSVREISISTYCDFNINGRVNKSYFDTDLTPESEYALWGKLRPICYELIKGKILPLKMNFVLSLPSALSDKILLDGGFHNSSDISLLLNIRYEQGNVNVINATSTSSFSLDKSYEKIWDDYFTKEINRYNF